MLWSIFTCIITHHRLGRFSGLINGLIAAAIGALSMLTSEPTAKSNVKRTCMFVLSLYVRAKKGRTTNVEGSLADPQSGLCSLSTEEICKVQAIYGREDGSVSTFSHGQLSWRHGRSTTNTFKKKTAATGNKTQ